MTTNERGRFITIEGIEGVGKSTNIQAIEDWLQDQQIKYLLTREPGGTELAEEIRELLLSPREEPMSSTAELLLIFAARSQHLQQRIRPALESGVWVICDRFTDATFAYQGAGRGLDVETISQLESLVQGSLRPDLTLVLDLDPKLGLERAEHRGELDRFEQEDIEFFSLVREAYLTIARREPQRCAVIDAALPLEQVQAQVLKTIQDRLLS